MRKLSDNSCSSHFHPPRPPGTPPVEGITIDIPSLGGVRDSSRPSLAKPEAGGGFTRYLLILLITLFAVSTHADQVVQEFTWEGDVLRMANESDEPMTKTILEIEAPRITRDEFALIGRVKYENVEGDGYLEMLNHFGERGAFFSRTLANFGPMKKLSGTSDWRTFRLPFTSNPDMPPPERLVVNVVLPGRGTVHLSPLKLVQDGRTAWWDSRQAGWLGGILGSSLGILGALIGILASKGKARALVMALYRVMLVFGLFSLLAGLFAALRSQPYHVYYPLLLVGAISMIVMIANRGALRRRYEEQELRRMESLDV